MEESAETSDIEQHHYALIRITLLIIQFIHVVLTKASSSFKLAIHYHITATSAVKPINLAFRAY